MYLPHLLSNDHRYMEYNKYLSPNWWGILLIYLSMINMKNIFFICIHIYKSFKILIYLVRGKQNYQTFMANHAGCMNIINGLFKKLRRWSCAFQGPIDYVMSLIYICCRILRTFHIIFRFCSVISPHNLFDRFLDPDYKTSIFFKEKINTYVLNNKRTNKKLMSKNNSLYHF